MATYQPLELRPREAEELLIAQQTIGPIQDFISPLYEIVTIPNRGRGTRARRFIPKSALILEEKALFVVEDMEDPLTRRNIQTITDQADQHPAFDRLYWPGPSKCADCRRAFQCQ